MNYNPYNLESKVILVTGASSGIGRATAIECSRLGARVIISGRNAERLNETFLLLEGEGHNMIVADMSVQPEIDSIIEKIPSLDGLVNNAVMSVLKDKNGNLWFGTKWFGLSRFDGKTFTTFSQYDN